MEGTRKTRKLIIAIMVVAVIVLSFSFSGTDAFSEAATGELSNAEIDLINDGIGTLEKSRKQSIRLDGKVIMVKESLPAVECVEATSSNDIRVLDTYVIKDADENEQGEHEIVTVTEMEVKSTTSSKDKTQVCGRVTAYSKTWYTSKSVSGFTCRKVTKTGGKITNNSQNVTIRNLRSELKGLGRWCDSSGTFHNTGQFLKQHTFSVTNPTTMKTWSTQYDRYYVDGANGILQTRFYVTYGGTNADQQATYHIKIQICSMV